LRVGLCKPSFEEEEEGAEGNQRWFGRTRGSAILHWIPSVLIFSVLDRRWCATCWGRDHERVCNWWFWEISPTLILVPTFIQKKNNGGNKHGLYQFWTPGSLNFIQIKSEKCLKHQFFFCFFNYFLFFCKDNPGYLSAVLGLWSQARPWEFILQLPWWCSSQLHHHILIYHRSSCKVSAQIQLRALQRYYDKQNQKLPS